MHGDRSAGKETVARFFGGAATTFGQDEGIRRFPHFGRRLVEVARVPAGARVLDVATGRGAVLFPAAEQVGPEGSVLGVDISPAMVAATARDIEARGVANAVVRVMDAEELDIAPGSLDVVLCGFGLMFLPHLERALAGFRRVLRPGGLLAVSTWGERDPRFAWEAELWQSYGIGNQRVESLMPQRLREAGQLTAVLRDAGFSDVRVTPEVDELFHAEPEVWWTRMQVQATTKSSLESLGPEKLPRFREDAFDHLRSLAGPGGIAQRIEANFAFAHST